MSHNKAAIALCLLLLIGPGCATLNTGHTATPVEAGEGDISADVGMIGFWRDFDSDNQRPRRAVAAPGPEWIALPNMGGGARFGVTENSDFGVRAEIAWPLLVLAVSDDEQGWIGGTFDYNYAFVNRDHMAISVNPTLITQRPGGMIGFGNVLVDVIKTEDTTVTFGLKPGFGAPIDETNSDRSIRFVSGAFAGIEFDTSSAETLLDTDKVMVSLDAVDWCQSLISETSCIAFQATFGFKFHLSSSNGEK